MTRRAEVGVLVSPVTRDLDVARGELLDLRRTLDLERAETSREKRAILTAHQRHVRMLETEINILRRESAEAIGHLDQILADG